MTRSIIVWGTSSGAGKSLLATALARIAARRGLRVAPFKAQNMSNNARVVPGLHGEAGEIGAAQYFQALAAGAGPQVDHNPVLLKPERDTASQVVVHGRVRRDLAALPWRERSPLLAAAARQSFERLAAANELIVVEGAGSPAEINLADCDFVNLDTARWARDAGPAAALLVTDFDRGGAFAHLAGTVALLPDDLRPLLHGGVLNKFRGDVRLLEPGPQLLEQRCGLALAGVLPMWRGHGLPDEDGIFDERPQGSGAPRCRVVVVAPPAASNLDEFAPLARTPGVQLRWARDAAALADAELVVLPGSKQVSGDLRWLRQRGIDAALQAHAAAGRRLLGICGGAMLLGRSIADPEGADGEACAATPGLGLLPLATVFESPKLLRRSAATWQPGGAWSALDGAACSGYEIRLGRIAGGERAVVLRRDDGEPLGWQRGSVLGITLHGMFESPALLRALFGAEPRRLDRVFDRLATFVERRLDVALLRRLLG